MITRFQQAVLQEMGIPRWVSQQDITRESSAEAASPANEGHAPVTHATPRRSENSSSHLAALRQSLSGDKATGKTQTSEMPPSEVSPSGMPPSEMSPSEMSPSGMPPSGTPPGETPPSKGSTNKPFSNVTTATETSAEAQAPKNEPTTRALSGEEQHLAIVNDISLAFELAGKAPPATIVVGDALLVASETLTLPRSPQQLDAHDKRQIWTMISTGDNR